MYILIIIGLVLLLVLYYKWFRVPTFGNLIVVSGAVKAGKSTMSFRLAQKQYQRQLWKYRFKRYIAFPICKKILRKDVSKPEVPLFYSNIPCAVKNFSPLTEELILRTQRFRYGSVIYCDEASLVADSQLIKNIETNERLLLFNKLIGHETKGGYLIYNTQSIGDLHYAIKRCTGSYFYVHHNVKLPGFVVMYFRELFFSDDMGTSSAINVSDKDIEHELRRIIVPKSVWKRFDCYCYSSFTDDLPVSDEVVVIQKKDKKKVKEIVSFRTFTSLQRRFQKNEKFKGKD